MRGFFAAVSKSIYIEKTTLNKGVTMSSATKTDMGRRTYAFLLLILCGCSAPSINAVTWKTYSNSRYKFEFPYPSSWTSLPAPENDDGIAFVSPQNNTVEIRGWAGNQLPDAMINKNAKKTVYTNFRTNQGMSGVLEVEVGSQESSMKLTLTQGQLKYYWLGRSQAREFSKYYRMFYYIAQEYRILGD